MRWFAPIAVTAALLFAPAAFAQTGITPDSANPPGTAAGRALDRAAGTDTSGAYPNQADGSAENPKGTMTSRAAHHANRKVHHAARHNTQTSTNNSASRTLDRAAGTNNSGAYPSQTAGTRQARPLVGLLAPPTRNSTILFRGSTGVMGSQLGGAAL